MRYTTVTSKIRRCEPNRFTAPFFMLFPKDMPRCFGWKHCHPHFRSRLRRHGEVKKILYFSLLLNIRGEVRKARHFSRKQRARILSDKTRNDRDAWKKNYILVVVIFRNRYHPVVWPLYDFTSKRISYRCRLNNIISREPEILNYDFPYVAGTDGTRLRTKII